METVYIVIEDGMIKDVRCADPAVDVVVLDRDTVDLVALAEIDKRIEEISDLPEIEIY